MDDLCPQYNHFSLISLSVFASTAKRVKDGKRQGEPKQAKNGRKKKPLAFPSACEMIHSSHLLRVKRRVSGNFVCEFVSLSCVWPFNVHAR